MSTKIALLVFTPKCLIPPNHHVVGYIISHPWILFQPPKLNTLLEALPGNPDTYYIHDLAILPQYQGYKMATKVVVGLFRHAVGLGYKNSSLVSVNNTAPFWHKFGFLIYENEDLAAALRSYNDEARFMVKYF